MIAHQPPPRAPRGSVKGGGVLVRCPPALKARVTKAAHERGVNVAEFFRRAAEAACDEMDRERPARRKG